MTSQRAYEKSHPFISFRMDLSRAPVELWMLLGEAVSKCEHLAGVPLKPEVAQHLHKLYLVKGVRATTAIEGNTLTEEEVRQRIEGGSEALPPSKEYLGKEIDNILKACNGVIIKDLVDGKPDRLTPERVKLFNRLVLDGLELEEGVVPGEIRHHSVGVGHSYRGAPAQDCDYLLERLCDWLNEPQLQGGTARIQEQGIALLKAMWAHLYLAWIHPFGDGNGRTARLIEFQLLVSVGVPVPAAHLLSDHYNQTRNRYYRELDYASQSKGDVTKFLQYATQGLVDGLRGQIALIREQQLHVAWQNYAHEAFGKMKHSPSERRRLYLALDLAAQAAPVPYQSLATITPRVAAAYATKTSRALSRDLNVLTRMRLVRRKATGYVANKKEILAFLPLRKAVLKPEPTPGVVDAEEYATEGLGGAATAAR